MFGMMWSLRGFSLAVSALYPADDELETSPMTTPAIGGTAPIPVEVEAGKDYWWCSCGLSKNQPFCDGSHQGGPFMPMQYTAAESKKLFFCTCKATAKSPLCDGAHLKLAKG